jgi:hypothetical protein
MTMNGMMKSSATTSGWVLVLPLFAAACGSSDSEGALDGGKQTDGESSADGMHATDAGGSDGTGDARNLSDGEPTNDGDGPPDEGALAPGAVNLGSAASYVILAKSGISTVPTSAVTGNLGLSPAAASYITGFSLTASPTNVFSTSLQVTGKVYASNYHVPTPANLTTAVSDMQLAFTDAAGRAPDFTELGAGNVGGKTLVAGVYKWSTGLLIPTDLTLTGGAADVWIFQIAKNLMVDSAVHVVLAGGAMSKNVFWQVAGDVSLGTTAQFQGVILGQTSIGLKTGASINGRLFAQTAVTIDDSAVVSPAE